MAFITIPANELDKDQVEALKAFLKALKIKFVVAKDKPYDEKFVEMVLQGDKDRKKGKGKKLSQKDIENLWK
ncbi:MAG: DUF2683 family protein [Bacteroidota bacterium]